MEKIKIVYLYIDRVPINDLAQVFFFTEKNGEIFLGTDNNTIELKDIQRWVAKKKVFQLKEPIIINKDEKIFIGYADSKIYVSNLSKEKLRFIGKSEDLIL